MNQSKFGFLLERATFLRDFTRRREEYIESSVDRGDREVVATTETAATNYSRGMFHCNVLKCDLCGGRVTCRCDLEGASKTKH